MAGFWAVQRGKWSRPGRRASYREGASFGALTFCVSALVSVVSAVVNSRLYGLVVIGEYALAVAAVTAVRLISTTKERPALVRELATAAPQTPRVTGLVAATLTFSVTLTCAVSVLTLVVIHVLLAGPVSQPELFLPLLVNVAGYALIGNTGENLEVVLGAFRAGRPLFWVRLVDALAFLAIAVPLGIANGTVWGLIIASVGAQAVGLLHRTVRVRRFMRFSASKQVLRQGFQTLPDLVRFGLKVAPGALADGASNESGTWLVAAFSSIAAVGAYGRAYLLIKQVMAVNLYINEMLFPTLVERRANEDVAGFSRALVDSLRYTTYGLLALAVACGGVAEGIMRIFGPGFERGADALTILLFVPQLSAMSQIQRFALLSIDRPWLGSVSGLLRLAVTMVTGLVLTWKLGAVGAALGLVTGLLADIAFSGRIVAGHLEPSFRHLWPGREWFGMAVAGVAAFAVSRGLYLTLPFPISLIGFAGGCVVFVSVLIFGGAIGERDRARYRDIRRRFSRRRRVTNVPQTVRSLDVE